MTGRDVLRDELLEEGNTGSLTSEGLLSRGVRRSIQVPSVRGRNQMGPCLPLCPTAPPFWVLRSHVATAQQGTLFHARS